MLQLSEQVSGSQGGAGGVAAGGGDVGGSGEAVTADREVAQHGHDGGAGAGADLGQVFGEGDVADPVQPVLHVPVPADDVGELLGADVGEAEAGDRVDRLGRPLLGAADRASTPDDPGGQAGVGEPDPCC